MYGRGEYPVEATVRKFGAVNTVVLRLGNMQMKMLDDDVHLFLSGHLGDINCDMKKFTVAKMVKGGLQEGC